MTNKRLHDKMKILRAIRSIKDALNDIEGVQLPDISKQKECLENTLLELQKYTLT